MKKTINRYIAIAFAVLALFVAYVEINVSGIPFFAFICALASKQFYDDSVGRVTNAAVQPRFTTSTEQPHFHDNGPNSSLDLLDRERSLNHPFNQ
jgi:hypothetical protein